MKISQWTRGNFCMQLPWKHRLSRTPLFKWSHTAIINETKIIFTCNAHVTNEIQFRIVLVLVPVNVVVYRVTRNCDDNNHIAVNHQLTNHNIDCDSAQCLTYSINCFQRLTRLGSWYTILEQTPLNRCQQLPASYKRLIHDGHESDNRTSNRPT